MMMQPPSPRNPDLLPSTLPYYSDSQVFWLQLWSAVNDDGVMVVFDNYNTTLRHHPSPLRIWWWQLDGDSIFVMCIQQHDMITRWHCVLISSARFWNIIDTHLIFQVSFSPAEEIRGVRLPPQTLPYYSERNTLSPQVTEFYGYGILICIRICICILYSQVSSRPSPSPPGGRTSHISPRPRRL